MILLQNRSVALWNSVLAFSLALIPICAWFIWLYAPTDPHAARYGTELTRHRTATASAQKRTVQNLSPIHAKTWDLSQEELGSRTLASLTDLAEANNVQIAGFRTEKAVAVADLSEVPFVVVVEGKFPDIVALAKALESPDSKLAVNLVQVSASDSATNRVTATLGLVGFIFREAAK